MSKCEDKLALLEGILERIDLPLLLLDENQTILYANSDFLKYFGKDQVSAVGKPIEEVISIRGATDIFAFEDTGPPYDELLITCNSSNTEKEFYFSGQKFPLPNNKDGLLIVARDVTIRRKLERELQESEKKYREMIDNSSDAIFVIADDGRFMEVNKKAQELYSYTEEEFMNITFPDLLASNGDPQLIMEKLKDIIEKDSDKFLEQMHKTKDGKEIVVEISAAYLPTSQGAILLMVRDLSFRKKIEQQLLKAEKLSTLSAALSTLRHEINNPLTVIMGESQLLMIEEKNLSEKVMARISNIHQMGQRISNALMKLSYFVKGEKEDTVELAGIRMFKLNDD